MINVVLMAGSGKRFTDAGYKTNKALLPVSGKPMIIQAVNSMPKADKWVFVVRQEHMDDKVLIDTLKSVASDVAVVVDPNPIGQLNSCLVAKEHYDNGESLFVGACDFGMVWNKEKYAKALSDGPDMISWSFTKQPNLARNPQAWGWLKVDENSRIHGVSVKVPISSTPINDFAITGSFSFKSGRGFLKIAEELMRRGVTVKGEYYIDSMIAVAIEMGYKAVSFPVDKYIGWGVPADYEEYIYWEQAIAHPDAHPDARIKPEYLFWHSYFVR